MAADVIRRIREVSAVPIKYVLLSHYHAVRVLGASAFKAEGLEQVIASDATLALIRERGEQDKASEIGRFPRLFRNVESVPPGLTWPTLTFSGRLSLDLGGVQVEMFSPGRGHTAGDTVAWLPEERVLFSGDLVEFDATPYCGDAHFADWPATLEAIARLDAAALVPGRGPALKGAEQVAAGLAGTRAFVSELYAAVQAGVQAGEELKAVYQRTMAALRPKYGHWVIFDHCMPFDVTRAYDEAGGLSHPRIWTAERDVEMWKALEGA
jgi:glyoxylase-like metal-dependent hydrolase (beta-lactamase superfamily II)